MTEEVGERTSCSYVEQMTQEWFLRVKEKGPIPFSFITTEVMKLGVVGTMRGTRITGVIREPSDDELARLKEVGLDADNKPCVLIDTGYRRPEEPKARRSKKAKARDDLDFVEVLCSGQLWIRSDSEDEVHPGKTKEGFVPVTPHQATTFLSYIENGIPREPQKLPPLF